MDNSLGRKIKYFRKRAGLTQMALELEINAAPGSISRLESGEINPTKETIHKISKKLRLTDRENDYLYGNLIESADDELLNHIRQESKEYFSKKGVIAYILDDRYRLITVSDTLLKLLAYDTALYKETLGKSFVRLFIDERFKLRGYISPKYYDEVLYNLLARFYAEVGFMEGDQYYQEALWYVVNDPKALSFWKDISSKPPINLHILEERKVNFKFGAFEFPLVYSDEPLTHHRRFELVEYTPTSKLIRLFSMFF